MVLGFGGFVGFLFLVSFIVNTGVNPVEEASEIFWLVVEDGTLVWPNGADLCPDVLIWDGLPPANSASDAA